MYEGVRVRFAAIRIAKSVADETVKTTPYGFGHLALLVYRLVPIPDIFDKYKK